MKKVKAAQITPQTKDVIAFRKSCAAAGAGLSHYLLMDQKAKS
jgi:modified peptide precursor CbpA